jgi:hypothetical protein
VGALKPTYWQALIVVCVIYFTRFDWSFVVLRAKQVWLPLLLYLLCSPHQTVLVQEQTMRLCARMCCPTTELQDLQIGRQQRQVVRYIQ